MSKKATSARTSARTGGKGSNNKIRLAKRLLEWSKEEMKYASESEEDSLCQEDIQLLLRGELAELLEFVVNQVKEPSKAEVIRGNLALHNVVVGAGREGEGSGGGGGGSGGGGRGRLVMEEERSRLEKEEASLKMAVEQLTKDVTRLRENITNLSNVRRSVEDSVASVSRGSALISAHSFVCEEMVRALQEFSRRIRARVELFQRLHFPLPHLFKNYYSQVRVRHSVRVICFNLEENLSVFRGTSEGERKEGMDRAWKHIEDLLAQYTPGEILASLEEVTRQTAANIHSQTLSIDLNRDAQQLKYSYDGSEEEEVGRGRVKDGSKEHGLLNMVEERLMEAQLSHIQQSVEIERSRKAAEEARSQSTRLQTEILQLLEEKIGQQGKEEHLELAKLLYTRLDLECAGSRAVLDGINSVVSALDEAQAKRQRTVEMLQTKLRKIEEFAEVVESKQKRIEELVLHNSSAKSRLQKQALELQVYVEENVTGHQRVLTDLVHHLRDSVKLEIQAFTGLSLERLLKAPSTEVPSCDLSINSLRKDQSAGQTFVSAITTALNLPPHCAPENVLKKLLDTQEKVEKLGRDAAEVDRALQQMRITTVNSDSTQDLMVRCREHESWLFEKAIPVLKECLSRTTSGLVDCERTAETLEHWWSQPAQFLTPWISHSEVTAEQWVDKWKVLAARFNELGGH